MGIQIKKLVESAIIPSKGSEHSAGYDLSSIEEYILTPMETKLFKTGISISIPKGQYGRIAPRSGLALKNSIDTLAGVIDSDYRGEIGVILINLGKTEKKFSIGDKIAQIIFEFYNDHKFELVDDLTQTVRGEGGFGSTTSPIGKTPTLGYHPDSVPPIIAKFQKLPGIIDKYTEAGGVSIKEKYTEELKKKQEEQ